MKSFFCFILNIHLCLGVLIAQYEPKITSFCVTPELLIVQAGELYPDRIAAVNTNKGVVIIDSGISPSLSREYRKIIESKFPDKPIKYLINTHHDFDHTNGNMVFKDATIIAHKNCPIRMKEFLDSNIAEFVKARKSRYNRRAELALKLDQNSDLFKRLKDLVFTSEKMCYDFDNQFKPTFPDLTFDKELTLDLGNTKCNIYHFKEGLHTDNDVVIHFPELGLLFSGDLFGSQQTNSYYSSSLPYSSYIKTLDKILLNEVEHVITVHSGILNRARIKYERDNFANLLDITRNRKNGVEVLRKTVLNENLPEVKSLLIDIKEDYETHYFFEADINSLADELIASSKFEEAILILHLNDKLFPKSPDTKEWLAYAYMSAQKYEEALKYFDLTLKMNPVNSYAADMLYVIEKNLKTN